MLITSVAPEAHAQPGAPNETLREQQRRERNRQIDAGIVRQMLSLTRVTDRVAQDAVVEWDEKRREAAQASGFQLLLRSRILVASVASGTATDAEIAAKLADLRAALQSEKERRTVALFDLKAKTNYEQDPNLETALMLLGVVGEEAATLGATPLALNRLGVKTVPEAAKKLLPGDEVLQTTLVQFVREQERALQPLLVLLDKNRTDEVTGRTALTDETRRAFLTDFRAKVADFQLKRERALVRLDAKIDYLHKPRLEAALLLMGVTSNDISLLDGFNLHGPRAFKRYSDLITGQPING
jgi:hypothetical protein